MKELLTIEQAAEFLGVAVNTIRKALQEGSLKAFKRFGRWYIFQEDVLDFIRSGECSTDKKNKTGK